MRPSLKTGNNRNLNNQFIFSAIFQFNHFKEKHDCIN